ncbi:hypothetical protein MRB53_038645 [Persea americana]|nr:hypothetical protein MRB53_038645 [Persea americana]
MLRRLSYSRHGSVIGHVCARLARQQSTSSAALRISDFDLARLLERPLKSPTLADLLRCAADASQPIKADIHPRSHGAPPLSMSALYETANTTLALVPSRLAHRIRALRSLPSAVLGNGYIDQIHSNYMHSLSTLIPFAGEED